MKFTTERYEKKWVFIVLFFLFIIHGFFCCYTLDDIDVYEKVRAVGFNNFYLNHVKLGGWSSRFIIDFVSIICITQIPFFVWNILNALVSVIMVFYISTLFEETENILLTSALVFIIPSHMVMSAGIVATTVSYWWTACAAIICVCSMYRCVKGSIKKIDAICGTISAIYCSDSELGNVFLLVVGIINLFYSLKKSNKSIKYIYLMLMEVYLVIRVVIHWFWKMYSYRVDEEIISWFPDYAQRNILDKIQTGLTSCCYILFKDEPIYVFILCMVLCGIVFSMYKDNYHRIIVLVPTILVVEGIAGKFINSGIVVLEQLDSSYNGNYGMISNGNFYYYENYLLLFLWAISLWCIIRTIVSSFNGYDAIFMIALLIAGGISRGIMGLSPTVAASAARTGIFLFVALMLSIVFLINKLYVINKSLCLYARYGIYILGAMSYVNNLIYIFKNYWS